MLQAGQRLPPRKTPSAPAGGETEASRPGWREGRRPQTGGSIRSPAAPAGGGGKRLPWSFFFPLTLQPGLAVAADLWPDFCSRREREKML